MKNKAKKNTIERSVQNMQSKSKSFGKANWLTVTRLILMVPFILFTIVISALRFHGGFIGAGNTVSIVSTVFYAFCVAIFIVAMVTDLLDGYIARKTKTVSTFGKIFDPIADKVATASMMILLGMVNVVYFSLIILFIVRDIIVDGCRIYAARKNVQVEANTLGKVKTLLVSISLIVIAILGPYLITLNFYWLILLNAPLMAGLVLAWWSGIVYVKKYISGILSEMPKMDRPDSKSKDGGEDSDLDDEEKNEDFTEASDTSKIKDDKDKTIDFSKTNIF
ncbi:CDP-diacylglycerol--glycerol-3-phosphate 3-phosphatidyltransferase [Metamycoplasma subdolum]|uniref:CDP-diacylglycerol--glycerol-3-phosphate 3-phosphatidyltransferase n=1 Tax=Metamycoplasma subdolum TaxID=92407 RepID=A0A3M0A246_9BACT|nr:CDP-diacylglycerol--glycerol-3-phosphate 3-phosphatidyltransferase [Metamycoplasma subdolum]RMA77529.1 CDP-diacylglycerol--glycerol-3-phosphate 3-phosphatidyltransferase [Metamycoplasma subdolum]WPB50722.1 CDP-diacylglycerol--glycerol-3-phosphate 3-phosphatidyltransferase [Metamycoplasma subdolum]